MPELIREVTITDLEQIKEVLGIAYHQNVALDCVSSYQRLGQRISFSALTRRLEAVVEKLDAILEEETDA